MNKRKMLYVKAVKGGDKIINLIDTVHVPDFWKKLDHFFGSTNKSIFELFKVKTIHMIDVEEDGWDSFYEFDQHQLMINLIEGENGINTKYCLYRLNVGLIVLGGNTSFDYFNIINYHTIELWVENGKKYMFDTLKQEEIEYSE